jgi:hypothetical protein
MAMPARARRVGICGAVLIVGQVTVEKQVGIVTIMVQRSCNEIANVKLEDES